MRVALINEGTYPYAGGGVSTWCDHLVRGLPGVRWHLVSIVAGDNAPPTPLLLVALLLVVVGTRLRLHTLALPALIGLAVFVFRVTIDHFAGELAWPLGLAVAGGLAMIAALASLLWRVHRQREAMI